MINSDLRAQMRFEAERKSLGVAYILLLFLGGFGAHRFYAGETQTASVQLGLSIVGFLTLFAGVGLLLLAAVWIWATIDLVLLPEMIRRRNLAILDRIA